MTEPRKVPRLWTRANVALLGTMPDAVLAARIGCNQSTVYKQRKRRYIEPYRKHYNKRGGSNVPQLEQGQHGNEEEAPPVPGTPE